VRDRAGLSGVARHFIGGRTGQDLAANVRLDARASAARAAGRPRRVSAARARSRRGGVAAWLPRQQLAAHRCFGLRSGRTLGAVRNRVVELRHFGKQHNRDLRGGIGLFRLLGGQLKGVCRDSTSQGRASGDHARFDAIDNLVADFPAFGRNIVDLAREARGFWIDALPPLFRKDLQLVGLRPILEDRIRARGITSRQVPKGPAAACGGTELVTCLRIGRARRSNADTNQREDGAGSDFSRPAESFSCAKKAVVSLSIRPAMDDSTPRSTT
jgi:hypothetical protein